ncbi:MAG: beta-ketoacyl synthase chain length factor [Campylobacterota bacterium]|nr:beta-ketoacyl synthase chain length factor [Campylobacterota bacterium]
MKINLEILDSAFIYAPTQIEELNTKELVPKMVTRRRLTRASKIAIYLASQTSFENGRIIYGTQYGEAAATSTILNSINNKENISPTVFQNSVYNTAVSYLSIISGNKNEITTISSGDKTSLNVLKSGAIKALDGDTILLICCETLNIENIEKINSCIDFLECGVALKVKITNKVKTLEFTDKTINEKIPKSISDMVNIVKNLNSDKENIIEINI